MATITFGNAQEQSLANNGASWAIASIIIILLAFAFIGVNYENEEEPMVESINP